MRPPSITPITIATMKSAIWVVASCDRPARAYRASSQAAVTKPRTYDRP